MFYEYFEYKLMKKVMIVLIALIIAFPYTGIIRRETNSIEDKPTIHISNTNDYCILQLENALYMYSEGYPILPYYVKTYTYPAGTKINEINVEAKKIEEIKLEKKIQPAPPAMPLNMEYKYEIKEGEIYSKDEFYPNEWYDYSIGMGIKDGKHVVFLNIYLYPVRYNAIRNEVLYAKDFDISIDYKLPSQPLFNKDEYDLLIICPDNWVEQLQPLKEHKEKYGIKTIIVSLDEIYGGKYFATQGRDSAEKIKYFIKDAIENWGIEYVLLVGGRKFSKEEWIMPARYAYSIDKVPPFTENGYLSDLYFADIYDANGNFSSWDTNGNGIYAEYDYNGRYDDVDLYPDVYVGRLPCRNKLELKIVVNKIIQYEKGQGEWKRRAILCGGDTDLNDRDDINEGEYLNEKVAEVLEDYDCIFLWTSLNTLSRKNFWQEMMKGAKFVDLSGHGSPNSWATHPHNSDEWIGITLFDIFTYFNGEKLPIFFANACHTCQFNLTYECFGWSFVKKAGGGAIAFIGSTGLSYGFGGYATAESLSGYLEIEFFRNHNEEFLGNAFYNAIISYLNNIPMDDWQDYKTVEEYVLFGLPCLKMN